MMSKPAGLVTLYICKLPIHCEARLNTGDTITCPCVTPTVKHINDMRSVTIVLSIMIFMEVLGNRPLLTARLVFLFCGQLLSTN